MDSLKVFESPDFGSVFIIDDAQSNQLLFCARDICAALGYSNGRKAVQDHVEKGDVTKRDTPIPNQHGTVVMQPITYVTESGLYSLIFGSKQERAKLFKRWVTSEVLPSIRKTGKYSTTHSSSVSDQLTANMAFADWSAKFLNLNEASKLGMARTIGDKFGMVTDALPQSVNAGTANPTTHAATDLLKKHDVGLSARSFNKVLELKGVVKQATRPGRNGKVHRWFVLQPQYDRFGESQQNPQYQQQTQIRWYDATFDELLVIVGLSKQQIIKFRTK